MTAAEWSTRKPAGWPSDRPVWAITALLLATATIPAMLFYQYRQEWTSLQRYYLGSYLRSRALAAMKADSVNRYVMIDVIGRKGQRPAINPEVEDLVTTDENGKAHTGYALSQAGIAAGDKRLVWHPIDDADNAKVHEYLKQWVYGNRSAWDLARPACTWGGGVLLAGLIAAFPLERRRSQLLRKGRRERGPELVTREQFNRKRIGDGIGFVTSPWPMTRVSSKRW